MPQRDINRDPENRWPSCLSDYRRWGGHLFSDGYPGPVPHGGVARVVAVDATSHGHLPISIGAGKIRSDTHLVDLCMERLFENSVEGVEAMATPSFV